MRPAYRHRQGQVFLITISGEEELMSPARAALELQSHKAGAKDLSVGEAAARVSGELADQLERAIGAAEIFNRASKPKRREKAA